MPCREEKVLDKGKKIHKIAKIAGIGKKIAKIAGRYRKEDSQDCW
jgi:hypothetical protein